MAKKKKETEATKAEEGAINIDGKSYDPLKLSEHAKHQILNIQFVDSQLAQLQNELAVSDTARIAYSKALQSELNKISNKNS